MGVVTEEMAPWPHMHGKQRMSYCAGVCAQQGVQNDRSALRREPRENRSPRRKAFLDMKESLVWVLLFRQI